MDTWSQASARRPIGRVWSYCPLRGGKQPWWRTPVRQAESVQKGQYGCPRTPGKVLAPLSLLAVSNQGPLRSPGQQSVVSFAVLHLRQGVNVGIWGSLE